MTTTLKQILKEAEAKMAACAEKHQDKLVNPWTAFQEGNK